MTKVSSKEALEFAKKHLKVFFMLPGEKAYNADVQKKRCRDLEKILYKDKAGRRETPRPPGTGYYVVYDGSESSQLVEAAKYDPVAFEAAKELCVEIIRRGETIPEPLNNWIADHLENSEKLKLGKKGAYTAVRDSAFAGIVLKLTEAGFQESHNDNVYDGKPCEEQHPPGKKSACDIVAQAYTELTGECVSPKTVRQVVSKAKREGEVLMVSDYLELDSIGGDS